MFVYGIRDIIYLIFLIIIIIIIFCYFIGIFCNKLIKKIIKWLKGGE